GSLVQGLEKLTAAAIAWERVQLFWRAATRREPIGQPDLAVAATSHSTLSATRGGEGRVREAGATPQHGPASNGVHAPVQGRVLLDARDLVFRYRDRGGPVLQGVTVQIRTGDRLLLEGPSGGGKSTLAALLAGARLPESGLMLFGGLDRDTL